MFSRNFFQTFQHPFTLDFDHSGTVHFLWGGWGGGGGGCRWDLKNMVTPHLHHKIFGGWPPFVASQNNWDDLLPTWLKMNGPPHWDWPWSYFLMICSCLHIKQVCTGCIWTMIRESLWPPKLSWIRGFIFVLHLGIYLVSAVTISSTFSHRRAKVLQSITGIDETRTAQSNVEVGNHLLLLPLSCMESISWVQHMKNDVVELTQLD